MAAPAATVTDAGTVRAALLEERPTEAPPVSAADASVTVQVVVEPDVIVFGEHVKVEITIGGGVTVTVAVAVPFNVPVTVIV